LFADCSFAAPRAEEYYYNAFFRAKMVLLGLILVHAAVFRVGVYHNGAALDAGGITGESRVAATLSLVLWLGLVICGRGIGYIEPPAIHSRPLSRRAALSGQESDARSREAGRKARVPGPSWRDFGTPTVREGSEQPRSPPRLRSGFRSVTKDRICESVMQVGCHETTLDLRGFSMFYFAVFVVLAVLLNLVGGAVLTNALALNLQPGGIPTRLCCL